MESAYKDLMFINKASRKIMDVESHTVGLGHGEMRTLHFITRNPGTTQQDISNKFGIDKSATARQCASLEEKGLIEKKENENDGRSRLLYPTEKALDLKRAHRITEERTFEQIFSVLTDDEKKELARLLRKITDGIKDTKGDRR